MIDNNKYDEYLSGNSFKRICDDFIDEEKKSIDISKKPKFIFLKTDWTELFYFKILPYIDWKFALVTHNSDRSIPSNNFPLLEDDRLVHWYGTNVDILHPKLSAIPIGIANEKWEHGNKVLLDQANKSQPDKKINRIYCNINIYTNANRQSILKQVSQYDFVDIDTERLSFDQYINKLKMYKWCISPPGNGIDCHRTWESIYVGTIPLVLDHLNYINFKDLPIHFLNSYDLNLDQLINLKIGNNLEKSTLTYWKNIVYNTKL